MKGIRSSIILLLAGLPFAQGSGQYIPSKPYSIPVYTPVFFNPAIAGSKDYTKFNLTSRILGSADAQSFSLHSRIRNGKGVFSPVGIGLTSYRDQLKVSNNFGVALAGAYHISLDEVKLNILSIGFSFGEHINFPLTTNGETPGDTAVTRYNSDIDFGVYYYGPTAFAGLSTTHFLISPVKEVVDETDEAYAPREYHLYGGYKFLIKRSSGIVLEPSVLISVTDSTLGKFYRHLTPYLKLYLQNFYIGTYYRSRDYLSVFFEYQFPHLYTGLFMEFPRKGFISDDNIVVELTVGLNLGRNNAQFVKYRHW